MIGKETGMLDVGKHCQFCRQVDFLPFRCKLCNNDYCAQHRSSISHSCSGLVKKAEVFETSVSHRRSKKGDNGEYFKSLLPKNAQERVKQDSTILEARSRSIKEQLILSGNRNALEKIKQFFSKYNQKCKYKMNMTSSNKIIELRKMRCNAKGDSKILESNRIYVWCYYIGKEKPVEHEIFISKLWPVGKALDYLSQYMNVKTENFSLETDLGARLFLYKRKKDNAWLMLEDSNRVNSVIEQGDVLYLVRGEFADRLK